MGAGWQQHAGPRSLRVVDVAFRDDGRCSYLSNKLADSGLAAHSHDTVPRAAPGRPAALPPCRPASLPPCHHAALPPPAALPPCLPVPASLPCCLDSG